MKLARLLPLLAFSLMARAETVLPAGTRIPVRLAHSLDTRRNVPGSQFTAHVAAPVSRDGRVVLPRGTQCRGHVVTSKSSGRLRGRAMMSLALDACEVDGRTYTVHTSRAGSVGKSHKGRNLAIIGGTTATGAAIGAIAGGGIGALAGAGAGAAVGTTGAVITGKKHVRLPAETPVTFALLQPVRVAK